MDDTVPRCTLREELAMMLDTARTVADDPDNEPGRIGLRNQADRLERLITNAPARQLDLDAPGDPVLSDPTTGKTATGEG